VAVVVAGLGWLLKKPFRLVAWSSAAVLLALPFVCGFSALRVQLNHSLDRFGCYYLPLLLATALLCLGQRSLAWSGLRGLRTARGWILWLAGLSLAASGALAGINLQYNFAQDYLSNHAVLVKDQECLPAYEWVRWNTPAGALFLVDDGVDWGQCEEDPRMIPWAVERVWDRIEFFLLIARRRCVYEERLHGHAIPQETLRQLYWLHRGTFGMHIPLQNYLDALKRFRPDYILWRKGAGGPRGYGANMRQLMASVVYSDAVCEIWRLSYSEPAVKSEVPNSKSEGNREK
jgi:hypothetical protein